jgi:hypothetical protein
LHLRTLLFRFDLDVIFEWIYAVYMSVDRCNMSE